jgi:hypothetical protein
MNASSNGRSLTPQPVFDFRYIPADERRLGVAGWAAEAA